MPSSKAVLHDIRTFGLSMNKAHNRITKDGRLVGYSQADEISDLEEMTKDLGTFQVHTNPTEEPKFTQLDNEEVVAALVPSGFGVPGSGIGVSFTISSDVGEQERTSDPVVEVSSEQGQSSIDAVTSISAVEVKVEASEVVPEGVSEKVDIKPKKTSRKVAAEKPIS